MACKKVLRYKGKERAEDPGVVDDTRHGRKAKGRAGGPDLAATTTLEYKRKRRPQGSGAFEGRRFDHKGKARAEWPRMLAYKRKDHRGQCTASNEASSSKRQSDPASRMIGTAAYMTMLGEMERGYPGKSKREEDEVTLPTKKLYSRRRYYVAIAVGFLVALIMALVIDKWFNAGPGNVKGSTTTPDKPSESIAVGGSRRGVVRQSNMRFDRDLSLPLDLSLETANERLEQALRRNPGIA